MVKWEWCLYLGKSPEEFGKTDWLTAVRLVNYARGMEDVRAKR